MFDFKASFIIVVLCLSTFVLANCSGAGLNQVSAESTISSGLVDLRLQPGDKVAVTVFGEDKLSGTYDVDMSGQLSMPLAGTMKVAGLTKREVEQLLTKKLKGQYLREPRVTVDVAAFRPFYILGEVEKPGEYPYKGELNVVSATAVAGGTTFRASSSYVLIQRSGTGQFQRYEFSPNIRVFPGDVVRIPERYF